MNLKISKIAAVLAFASLGATAGAATTSSATGHSTGISTGTSTANGTSTASGTLTANGISTANGSPTAGAPPLYTADGLYREGNALAAQRKLGLAILNYRRAALLSPSDADIQTRLAKAETMAGLPMPARSKYADLSTRVSANIMYVLGLFGLGAAAVGLLLVRFEPARRRLGWVSVTAGAALLTLGAFDAVATWHVMQEAIVVRPVAARISPVPAAESNFQLPEGTSVQIVSTYRGFDLVKSDSGQMGWVPLDGVELLIERS